MSAGAVPILAFAPSRDVMRRQLAVYGPLGVRELALEVAIRKLDKFYLLMLDDFSYVTKDQAETSVLFELISSRQRAAASDGKPADQTAGAPRRPLRNGA